MKITDRPRAGRRQFLRLSAGAAIAAGTVGMPAIVRAQNAHTFRFGSPTQPKTTYNDAMEKFASEAAKLSGGKIKIELYPSYQLGSIKDMLQATQLGTQSIGMAVPAWFASWAKQMDVYSLPFLVASQERLFAALTGSFGERVAKNVEPAGFKPLGYWVMGPRQLANNVRPLHKPEDLRGLKIRVINSPVFHETFRTLGANPVGLDAAEMYLALQQKTVDAVENATVDIVNLKLYEVTKYLSMTSHITDFFIVVMNKKLWDGLGSDEQKVMMQAMRASMDWEWKVQPDAIKASVEKLRGIMQVTDITPEERAMFIKATHPVYEKFAPSIGKDIIEEATRELGASA
jgi:tripartite ATP-independent transporter DctP family solute receptor